MPHPPPGPQPSFWVPLLALFAVIVGIVAGWLTWLGDHAVPAAVLSGGAGFAATMALGISVMKALRAP